jgi:hypothetical protein
VTTEKTREPRVEDDLALASILGAHVVALSELPPQIDPPVGPADVLPP